MATGLGSVERSSDQDNTDSRKKKIETFNCSHCLSKKVKKAAVKFCIQCDENFCAKCLQNHRTFRAMKDHKLEDCGITAKGNEQTQLAVTKTVCSKHPGKLTDMYCIDEETVCCAVCIALDHRHCENVDYILEVENAMKEMQDQLTDMKKTRENDLKKIKKRKQETLANIETFQNDIINKVKEMAKKTKEHVELKYIEPTADIENDIKATANMITETESNRKVIENITVEQNEEKVVIHMKTCKTNKSEGFKMLGDIGSHNNNQARAPCFQKDKDLDTIFNEMNLLGEVFCDKSSYEFSASVHGQYDEDIHSDISGSCQLQNGNIVLADNRSNLLKVLDTSYQLIEELELPKSPWGVCAISATEVAVTIPHMYLFRENNIQYVNIVNTSDGKTKMSLGKTFDVGSHCRGIAYCNKRLYVGCGGDGRNRNEQNLHGESKGHIKVFDLSGELLRKLQTDTNGRQLAWFPRNMVINKAGTTLFIANEEHGVCIIKIHSLEQIQIYDQSLKEINGICLRNDTNIIACGTKENGIGSIVTIVDKKFRSMIIDEELLNSPNSVLIDEVNSRLVVGGRRLRVFDLERKLF